MEILFNHRKPLTLIYFDKLNLRFSGFVYLLSLFFSFGVALCQPGGLSKKQHHKLSLDLSAGQFRWQIMDVSNRGTRFLSQLDYRPVEYAAFSFSIGLTRLELATPDEFLKDKYRLTYGGGLRLYPLSFPGLELKTFLSGDLSRFVALPDAERASSVGASTLIRRRAFRYDWLETNLDIGLEKRFKGVNLTAGVNMQFIHRKETFSEELLFNSVVTSSETRTGTYDSGGHTRPFVTFQIDLPQRLYLFTEAVLHDSDDFAILFGLGQVGIP